MLTSVTMSFVISSPLLMSAVTLTTDIVLLPDLLMSGETTKQIIKARTMHVIPSTVLFLNTSRNFNLMPPPIFWQR